MAEQLARLTDRAQFNLLKAERRDASWVTFWIVFGVGHYNKSRKCYTDAARDGVHSGCQHVRRAHAQSETARVWHAARCGGMASVRGNEELAATWLHCSFDPHQQTTPTSSPLRELEIAAISTLVFDSCRSRCPSDLSKSAQVQLPKNAEISGDYKFRTKTAKYRALEKSGRRE